MLFWTSLRLHRPPRFHDLCICVQDSLRRHNIMAVRQSDRIDPDELKRAKAPRKGRQMLSGSALLRLAFGLRLFDPVKKRARTTAKRGRYDQKNPQGMSARACAEVFSAGHTHVQNCRNAVSAWIIERQEEVAKLALGDADDRACPLFTHHSFARFVVHLLLN